jgi:RHH-type rel operon transcriptional repressor/antitoxin RelB
METLTTSIRLDRELLAAYDELARLTGRSRNYLLTEALREYLAWERDNQARLDASIAQADRGEFADEHDLQAWKESLFTQAGITPEERALHAREAEHELRQAYGLPPCG